MAQAARALFVARRLWVAALIASAALVLTWRYVAPHLVPLVVPEPTWTSFRSTRYLVHPKPVAFVRYFLALGAPVLLAVAVCSLPYRARRIARTGAADLLVLGVQASAVALLVACWVRQETLHRYFGNWQLGFALAVGVGLIAASPSLVARWIRAARVGSRRLAACVWTGVAAVVTTLWLLPAIFTESNVAHASFNVRYELSYIFDDFVSVTNGRHPLVDFVPLYSKLIPYPLGWTFSATGLSVLTFSLIMTVLSLVTLLAIYGTLSIVTGRRSWALALYLPFLAISLYSIQHGSSERVYLANLYDFFPLRLLGPFALAWFCARHLRAPTRVPHLLLFVLAGLVALNNAEYGVPSLVGLVAALWLGGEPTRRWERLRRLLTQALVGVALAGVGVVAVSLATSGALPDPSLYTYFSRMFAIQGFGLAETPLLGLHVVIYLTFAAALVIGAVSSWERLGTPALTPVARGLLIYVGIVGLGGLSIWAGRSEPAEILGVFPTWGLATVLLTWVAVQVAGSTGARNARFLRVWLVPTLAVGTTFGLMVSVVGQFPAPWVQVRRIASDHRQPVDGLPAGSITCLQAGRVAPVCRPHLTRADRRAAVRFVQHETHRGQPVAVFSDLGHAIGDESGVTDTLPFANSDAIAFPEQMQFVLGIFRDTGTKTLFTASIYPEVRSFLAAHGYHTVKTDRSSGLTEWVETPATHRSGARG